MPLLLDNAELDLSNVKIKHMSVHVLLIVLKYLSLLRIISKSSDKTDDNTDIWRRTIIMHKLLKTQMNSCM